MLLVNSLFGSSESNSGDKLGELTLRRFLNGDNSQFVANANRDVGTHGHLQQSLLNRRFDSSPGFNSTAFGDVLVNRRMRSQQDAIANVLGDLEQQKLDVATTLVDLKERRADRKAQKDAATQQSVSQGLGGLVTAGAFLLSSKDRKKDITDADTEKLLQSVKKAKIRNYRFVEGDEEDDGLMHTGLIAEEAPQEVQVVGGKQINTRDSIGLLLGALQQLATDFDEMKDEFQKEKDKMKQRAMQTKPVQQRAMQTKPRSK
jgi:hypothetical protein